ncbi:MAG: YggS family pyridoxal phosphate-dependent enzyme [Alphaproteobacteria bacterium]|nr:YggS family pyridoxal phosphate-dependent enzyme [Alphaproteobacteria bacterium]
MSLGAHYKEIKKFLELFGTSLVAVTKQQSEEKVDEILALGHRLFGENKVQEAKQRWRDSDRLQKCPDIRLHLIGGLQTNKVKEAVALFDVIETLDSEKLVAALAKEIQKQKKNIECFIQVNTGRELQKNGVMPDVLESLLHSAIQEHGLRVTGLMCIPPVDEDPVPHFILLRNLAKQHGLQHLSMGMSGDYKQAAEQGATFVRVGTALFGERI